MSVHALVSRTYSALLRLYPAGFRQEFGDEMHLVFEQQLESGAAPLRLLLREVAAAPAALLRAYVTEGKGVPLRLTSARGMATLAVIALISVCVASRTTYIIATSGLLSLWSMISVVVLLAAAGSVAAFALACRSPRVAWRAAGMALTLAAGAVFVTPELDRAAFANRTSTSAISRALPGVRLAAATFDSERAAARFVEANRAKARRFHVETWTSGGRLHTRVVTGGGADWLYGMLALIVAASSGHTTWRMARRAGAA